MGAEARTTIPTLLVPRVLLSWSQQELYGGEGGAAAELCSSTAAPDPRPAGGHQMAGIAARAAEAARARAYRPSLARRLHPQVGDV